MDALLEFLLYILFYKTGLRILRTITSGRFPENNSYLRAVPTIVGGFFVMATFFALLITSILLIRHLR